MRATRNPARRRLVVSLLSMAALVVAFLPQMALGATTGKLFSTNLVGTTELCVGASPSLTFQITNTSTQKITMGSANISIPSSLAVTGVTPSVTTSTNNRNWTASYNAAQRQIEVRSAKNSDGVPQNGWARVTFQVTASGPATSWIWGQPSHTPGSNANVFVKQSNNFSGSGNDLLPDTRSGATLATLTVTNCVDLETTITSQPQSETTTGQVVAYTVTVTNKATSGGNASGVTLQARTGYRNTTFQGLSPTILGDQTTMPGCDAVGSSVVCAPTSLTLSPGQSRSVKFTVTVPPAGSLTLNGAGTGYVERLITDAWSSSNEEVFPSVPTQGPTASDPICATTSPSNNYAVRCLDIDVPAADDSTVGGYLLPGGQLVVSNPEGDTSGLFTLTSGSGAFSLTADDCATIEDCYGGVITITPDCDDLDGNGTPDCRGLLVIEYQPSVGINADGFGSQYFAYYQKPGEEEKRMTMCNTTYTGGSETTGGYDTGNPQGTVNSLVPSTEQPIPCLWKYQQVGPPGSNKLQLQVVIDGEDPPIRTR